jgi:carboxypeptidase PM20D1
MHVWGKVVLASVAALAAASGGLVWNTLSYGAPEAARRAAAGASAVLPVPAMRTEVMAETLGAALREPTITLQAGDPQPGNEAPWLGLHALLAQAFPLTHAALSVETVGRLSLQFTWAGSDPGLPPLVLMAHQDVVPVNIGTEADWTYPAFAGVVADGYVWGRGAIDNKGSLVAILEAVEQLLASGFTPTRTVVLAFGHDEEVLGDGARLIAERLTAGGVRPFLVLDEGFAVLDPFPLTGKYAALIGVAEKGYATLELTAPATGGHSAMPPRNSGAVRLARALVALDDTQMRAAFDLPPVREMLRETAADMPFLTRMAFANLWLFRPLIEAQIAGDGASNAVMRTTTAPTMLEGSVKENVLPQMAKARVNFRLHPADSVDGLLAHVRRIAEPFDVEVRVLGVANPASEVSPTSGPAWDAIAAVAAAVQPGAPVAPGLVLGATDARWYSGRADAVYRFHPAIYSREDLSGFHGTNERLAVANLTRMAEGYARLILLSEPTTAPPAG